MNLKRFEVLGKGHLFNALCPKQVIAYVLGAVLYCHISVILIGWEHVFISELVGQSLNESLFKGVFG